MASKRLQLEAERIAAQADLSLVEAQIDARAHDVDIPRALRSIGRLIDIYAELDDPAERRRLLETCLDRLIVHPGNVELHVPEWRGIVSRPRQA